MRFGAWQVWKRTTHRSVTTTYWSGLRLRVYPDSMSASLALYTRLPEYDDMLFTSRFLRTGDLMIDVGANVGLYTLIAGARVDGGGRVIALEPDPVALVRLRENLELNRLTSVEVRGEAAGAARGEARLTTGLDTVNHIVAGDDGEPSIRVPVVPLDELVETGVEVALIKVDAEGFESEVLAGAQRLLRERSVIAWIVEVNGLGRRYGAGDETVRETFERSGYRAIRYDGDCNELAPPDRPSEETEWNLIFARDADELRRRLATVTV